MSNGHTTSLKPWTRHKLPPLAGSELMMKTMERERILFFSPSVPLFVLRQYRSNCKGTAGWLAKCRGEVKKKSMWYVQLYKYSSSLCVFVISSFPLVVKLRAGVKHSQAALRLTRCVDHPSLVRHGHIHCRLSPHKANLMHI